MFMGVGAILLGYGASAVAESLGAGFMLSFFVGGVGSIVGIILGWKLARMME